MATQTATEHVPPATCTCGLICAGCGKPLCQDDDNMATDGPDDEWLTWHVGCPEPDPAASFTQ